MDPMAKVFWYGLERSNLFIDVFTEGMAGEDWARRLPGIPNPAIWTLGHLAYQRGVVLELLPGHHTCPENWPGVFDR